MPSNFGSTPYSSETLPANTFPVSAVFVPGTASGNLTAMQGGPASTDGNGYTSAPGAIYVADGSDVTLGTTTDLSSANTAIGILKAIKANTASVTIGSLPAISGTVTANAGTNLNTSALALESGGNLAAILAALDDGQETMANSLSVAIASDQSVVPVSGTFWQATQPVSGTVTANAGTGNFTVAQATGTNLHTVVDSGTVTANIGTTNGLALDATVAKLNVAQATALGSNTGPMMQGSVTTAAPTYVTGNINPLSLDVSGLLRASLKDTPSNTNNFNVNLAASAATVTVSASNLQTNLNQIAGSAIGTAAAGIMKVGITDGSGTAITSTSSALDVNIKSGGGSGFSVVDEAAWTAATSAFVPAGGVFNDSAAALSSGQQGTTRLTNNRAIHVNLRDASANQLLGSKTSANSVPVVIASDQGAVAVSGTVTANVGTTNGLALDTSVNGLLLAQASTTSGQKGPLALGAVTTNAPSYTTAQSNPLSLDPSGLLRMSLKDTPANTNNFNVALAASSATVTVTAANLQTNVAQFGGNNVSTGTGAGGVGIPRVTVSNDSNVLATQSGTWTVQPGNTPNSTAWLVQNVVGTTGGSTPSHAISGASNNATSLKASAGMLYGGSVSNTNAAARYLKFYNKASAPAPATDNALIVWTIQVPANATVPFAVPEGMVFSTGIAFAAVANMSDTDNTSISAGDLSIDIRYK